MNKPLFFAALLAASLGASAARAESYIAGAVGQGHINVDCAGANACDNNGSAARVVGGVYFGFGFAAEVGYLSFGKTKANSQGVSVGFKSDAVTVGGAFSLPIAPLWVFNARLGMANVRTVRSESIGGLSFSDSDSKPTAYGGLGLGVQIAPHVGLEANVDSSQAEFQGARSNVRAFTVGVRINL